MSSSPGASNELLSAVHDLNEPQNWTSGNQVVKLEESPSSPPAESQAAVHPEAVTNIPVPPGANEPTGSQASQLSSHDQNGANMFSGFTPEQQYHEPITRTVVEPIPPISRHNRAYQKSSKKASIIDVWGEDETEQLLRIFDLGRSLPSFDDPAQRWQSLKISAVNWLWMLSKRYEIEVARDAILDARQQRIAAPMRVRPARQYITAMDVENAYHSLQRGSVTADPAPVVTGSASAVNHIHGDARDLESASEEETTLDEELEEQRQDGFSPTTPSSSTNDGVKTGRKRWPDFRRDVSSKRMRENTDEEPRRDSLIVTLRYIPRASNPTERGDARLSQETDEEELPVASSDSAQFLDVAARFADVVATQKEKLSEVDHLRQNLDWVNQSIPELDRVSKEKLSAFLTVSEEVDRCPDLRQTEILIKQREQAMAESTEASSARKKKQCEARHLEQQLMEAEEVLNDCNQLCMDRREAVLRTCDSLWKPPGNIGSAELAV